MTIFFLTAFSYEDSFRLVKNKHDSSFSGHLITDAKSKFIELTVGNDGGVYLLLSESIFRRLNINSPGKSEENLVEWGLNKDTERGSYNAYIAHLDRTRVSYPMIVGIFIFFFGVLGVLILNVILSLFLIREIYLWAGRYFPLYLAAATCFAITPIPQRIWVATPDIFIVLLISVLVRKIHEFSFGANFSHNDNVKPKRRLLRVNLQIISLVLLLNLTKPVFVILTPILIWHLLMRKGRNAWSWFTLGLNLLFLYLWKWMTQFNLTAKEFFNSQDVTKAITYWKFPNSELNMQQDQTWLNSLSASNSQGIGTTLKNFPTVMASELNYSISQSISFMLVLMVFPLLFLFRLKLWTNLLLLAGVGVACIISQSVSGGLGLNYRFLIPYLFLAIAFSVNASFQNFRFELAGRNRSY